MSETRYARASYAAIELSRKGSQRAEDLECGLFVGIGSRENNAKEEQWFVTILNTKDSVKIFNLAEFNVVTFEMSDKGTKYMTIFTKEDEDQKAAHEILKDFVKAMIKNNRGIDNDLYDELIDIDTYEGFNEDILTNGANLTSKAKETTGTTGTSSTNTNSTTTTTTTYNRKPEVTLITRKGKLPAKEKLETMREKVKALAAGTFEAPPIPIPAFDIETEEDKKTTQIAGHMGV